MRFCEKRVYIYVSKKIYINLLVVLLHILLFRVFNSQHTHNTSRRFDDRLNVDVEYPLVIRNSPLTFESCQNIFLYQISILTVEQIFQLTPRHSTTVLL